MEDVIISVILFSAMLVLHILRTQETLEILPAGNDYEIGSASILGSNDVQQDYFGVKKNNGVILMVLADGAGQYGEVAAKLSVDTFKELFEDENAALQPQYFFKRAANAANKKILNTLEERQGESSVAAVMVKNSQLFYTLVGNSKIAVFRNGDLIPVSEGQTVDVLVRHAYTEGKISRQETLALLNEHRRYNVLGQDSFQDIEIFDKPLTLEENDAVVIMSEGIFNVLRWVDMEQILSQRNSIQTLANNFIQAVKRSPQVYKDNATVLICRKNEGII